MRSLAQLSSNVRLETDPPLAPAELAVVRLALTRSGISVDKPPEAYTSRWKRAAAREAVENEDPRARYALSPRSTRGATRA